jgi:hypothetical protein
MKPGNLIRGFGQKGASEFKVHFDAYLEQKINFPRPYGRGIS